MLADRENYYVGFECDEPYTDKMMCSNRSFDNPEIWRDNLVELFFASKRQDNFYYQFMLNSAGAFCDLRQENRNQNVKWNSELEYKCSVTPGKMWTVEVRIPRRSMPELKGSCFIANFTRGRRLKPECGVRTSSYSWTKYLSRFSAEEGGTVVIGTVPESKSVIIGGDFDFPVSGNRMRKGKNLAWISSCPITVDEQIFMTKGQSIRLDAKNGRVILRQPIKMQLLNAGTRYGLSFYVKLKNVTSLNGKQGFTAAIRFGNNGPGRTFYPLKHPLSGNLDWTRYQCEFTIPAGFGEKGNPYLGFYLPLGVTGKVWLDHVEIIPIKSK